MIQWVTINVSLYLLVLAIGLRVRRCRFGLPCVFAAAWLVVALRYGDWVVGMVGEISSGRCSLGCIFSWTVCTVYATILLGPAAAWFIWKGREDIASLLVLVLAGNWLLWEVFAVGLLSFREFHMVTAAMPLLGLVTTLCIGPYALWKALVEKGESA
jgi:hypothetical protein